MSATSRSEPLREPVALLAAGLATSVGKGVVDSCAAIRAGIARTRPIRHHQVLEAGEHQLVPLLGHPVHPLTEGMAPAARWSVLAEAAANDLRAHATWADAETVGPWGALVVAPMLDDGRFFHVPSFGPTELQANLQRVLQHSLGVTPLGGHVEVLAAGPAGLGAAVQRAHDWLAAGAVRRVVVLTVDSLLDAASLAWLAAGNRLKHDDVPAGIAPGEAGAAFLLGAADDAPSASARITVATFLHEDRPWFDPERMRGDGLARVLRATTSASAAPIGGDVYTNLNGEVWRAHELGTAMATVGGALGAHRLLTPASSVGDVGAASSGIGLACALRAFARRANSSPRAWVLATSDYGECGILGLEGGQR